MDLWFRIRRKAPELVGVAGFKSSPKDGLVEIGYSMPEAHQRNGYRTETVRVLVGWALQNRDVRVVVAHPLPEPH